MEITLSFKNPELLSTAPDSTASVHLVDVPFKSIKGLSERLPEAMARVFSDLASQIVNANDKAESQEHMYRDWMGIKTS